MMLFLTNNLFGQSNKLEFYDKKRLLIDKYYFYEIHNKSLKYDSLKNLHFKRKSIIINFNNEYDSMKKAYTEKIKLEEDKNNKLTEQNIELDKRFDEIYNESNKIIPIYNKKVKENRFLKKTLFIVVGISTLIILVE